MTRPTAEEGAKMKRKITGLVESGLSVNQIARKLGKSGQAVLQYLHWHGLETAEMKRRRESNLDNISRAREN